MSYSPDTGHDCAAGLNRKCKETYEKIHKLEFGKTWKLYHMCP